MGVNVAILDQLGIGNNKLGNDTSGNGNCRRNGNYQQDLRMRLGDPIQTGKLKVWPEFQGRKTVFSEKPGTTKTTRLHFIHKNEGLAHQNSEIDEDDENGGWHSGKSMV